MRKDTLIRIITAPDFGRIDYRDDLFKLLDEIDRTIQLDKNPPEDELERRKLAITRRIEICSGVYIRFARYVCDAGADQDVWVEVDGHDTGGHIGSYGIMGLIEVYSN